MKSGEKKFLKNHYVAHLCTIDKNLDPHVVPVVYAVSGELIYTPVDEKPKKAGSEELQREKNIRVNSSVSLLVDDYSPDWKKLAWLQIRGKARIVTRGINYERGKKLIYKKYPQYGEMGIEIRKIIVIKPRKTIGWGFSGF